MPLETGFPAVSNGLRTSWSAVAGWLAVFVSVGGAVDHPADGGITGDRYPDEPDSED